MNELAPRPSLPCQPIPYGLVSLWEIMIGIEAASFATILHDIEKMRAATNSISLDKDACRSLVREAAALRIDLLKLGLTTSSIKCARFAAVVPDSGIAGSDFSNALKVLTETIEDELQGKYVFFLTSERSKYYPTKVNHIFGDLVEKAMDSEMLQDVSEAGKCLAFARDTAAVFHLTLPPPMPPI